MKRRKSARTTAVKTRSAKTKTVRAKRVGKSAPSRSRARRAPIKSKDDDFIDALMAASAQALGLAIDPAWRDGVKFNLRLVLDHARRVDEFPLPDDCEPASVFHA
jgi:Protein of unknown function (DUF4089)